MTNRTIKKILISARGEIAMRIIRTCREMNIGTVALYSRADRGAKHVKFADEAFEIGSQLSYLDVDGIIGIAKRTGADAIHPGYGFLAENATFAKKCRENDIAFIGPSTETIALMGSKIESRKFLAKHGIPIVPGLLIDEFPEEPESETALLERAEQLGFPLLVKADLGGGGKGIRLIQRKEDFLKLARQARGEADRAFGSGRIFVEKCFDNPKHIEVQIVSDSHGNHFHLFERECSIQRFHQKIVEEAPSHSLDETTREKLLETAVKIARIIKYENLGTVEFLYDNEGHFHFLEMNTRLQVEHPVTEMITGLDLVRLQIEIARGKNYKGFKTEARGHALECRICAEDPDTFLPTTGTVYNLHTPLGPFTRVDGGVYRDMKVTSFYDSMLSKLIVWADTREIAIQRMKRALLEYKIFGVQTNIPLHLDIISHPEFLKGTYGVNFIRDNFSNRVVEGDTEECIMEALLAAVAHDLESETDYKSGKTPEKEVSRWKHFHRYRRSLRL